MKTVLIVDDSAIMRLIIKNIVTKHGFDVVGEANNGHAGYEQYMKLKPDIVTMDITMRDLDGIGSLQKIIGSDPDAKVIMISAMGQDVVVRDAIKAGAKGFIVKPFTDEQLVESFSKL